MRLCENNLHRTRGLAVVLAVALCSLTAACAGSRPSVKVLGVSSHDPGLAMFVEVFNPSSRDIQLSRLDYELTSPGWLKGQGQVTVNRQIAPKSTAIVEIPIRVAREVTTAEQVDVKLEGRLYARENDIERSWPVYAHGKLSSEVSKRGHVFVRVADVN